MDPVRFDTLAKTLATPATRRGLVRLLTAVPVASGLLSLLARRRSRAARARATAARARPRTARARARTARGRRAPTRSSVSPPPVPRGARRAALSGMAVARRWTAAPAPRADLSQHRPLCHPVCRDVYDQHRVLFEGLHLRVQPGGRRLSGPVPSGLLHRCRWLEQRDAKRWCWPCGQGQRRVHPLGRLQQCLPGWRLHHHPRYLP